MGRGRGRDCLRPFNKSMGTTEKWMARHLCSGVSLWHALLDGYAQSRSGGRRLYPTTVRESEEALPKSTASQLAVTISHELRDPLGAIEASAYLIAQRLERLGVDDEALRRHLDKVRRQVQVCATVIGNMLELARQGERVCEAAGITSVGCEANEAGLQSSCEAKP
jgi:signal transduction histidine kinase